MGNSFFKISLVHVLLHIWNSSFYRLQSYINFSYFCRTFQGRLPVLVVKDQEILKHILIKDNPTFINRQAVSIGINTSVPINMAQSLNVASSLSAIFNKSVISWTYVIKIYNFRI